MINKFITVISTIGFISCSSCQSDLKESSTNHQVLHASYHSFLDSLSSADTLYITNESHGCEHYTIDSIRMYHQDNSIVAELAVYSFSKKKGSIFSKVSDSAAVRYGKFEQAIRTYKPSTIGSTSEDSYNIDFHSSSMKIDNVEITIPEYEKFKRALFGSSAITQLDSMKYH